ncbi:hypothetical protein M8C21_028886 [Ambrosia artemisiifolia]|uniref:Receptor ligand binding region domain-containing protein n=1 Tax=Ambrosia artemisiifolia TaxID=4212 RepID=A0AAD5CME1_AMBAR|nr:hypothetical protein M8C21_028886 [Ambrosia artemisiifolia]
MEMALHDFCTTIDTCSCPILHIKDSQGNSARSYYEVMDLMKGQVKAIIGTIGPQEATLVSEYDKTTNNIPIISLTPTATSSFPELETMPSFIQMSHDVKIHMQCIAAIVGHFSWRKVTPIYEDHSTFSTSPGMLTLLSDALQVVESTVERPSYREIEFWSPEFGFLNDKLGSGEVSLDLIYWPGGTQRIPIGRVLRNDEKPLKIGVPARGAFRQFVNVSYDPDKNETYVTGFSIQVFEAAVKKLNYSLSYVFVPYNGTYDDLVAEVHNKCV